jgi:hypothetical protein
VRSHRWAGALALALLAGTARASNERELRAQDRVAVGLALQGTAAPKTTSLAALQLAPTLDASVRVARAWVLTADATLARTAYRIDDGPRATATRSSNVLLGVRSGLPLPSPHLTLTLGLSVGIPLVTVPGGGIAASANAEQADRIALGAAGPRGTWAWARNAAPVVGFARATATFRALRFTLEVEPGLLISVNRDASRVALLTTGEVAVRAGGVTPYVALSFVLSSRALEGDDFAQTGAALGVRQELGAFFAWSELRLQLDGPAGLGDRYATFWGATLGVGARL